jgi:hypothetical protein
MDREFVVFIILAVSVFLIFQALHEKSVEEKGWMQGWMSQADKYFLSSKRYILSNYLASQTIQQNCILTLSRRIDMIFLISSAGWHFSEYRIVNKI